MSKHSKKKKVLRPSKGERRIAFVLNKIGIDFIQEKHFEDIKVNKPLPFDFYLPLLGVCIEFNGSHHYKKTRYSKNLNKRQQNDNLRKDYCERKGIDLLVIPHWEINNIESIIKETLYDLFIVQDVPVPI